MARTEAGVGFGTGMDPETFTVPPAPMPRDADTFDMFGDEPQPEPKGPADTIPTDSEGEEAGAVGGAE